MQLSLFIESPTNLNEWEEIRLALAPGRYENEILANNVLSLS